MSVQAMTRVMEFSNTRGVTRLVMLVIANHETEDRGAFPAVDRLARECGTGVRTVQECIRRATAVGELEVRFRQGPHGTNVYRTLCGLSTTAMLPGTDVTRIRTPQNPHPAETRRESAPELKELGVTGSSTAQASVGLQLFDTFWSIYPKQRRQGKGAARAAFTKALRRASADDILNGAALLAADPNLPVDEPRLIPMPATWLNQDRWQDDALPSRNGRVHDRAAEILREAWGNQEVSRGALTG